MDHYNRILQLMRPNTKRKDSVWSRLVNSILFYGMVRFSQKTFSHKLLQMKPILWLLSFLLFSLNVLTQSSLKLKNRNKSNTAIVSGEMLDSYPGDTIMIRVYDTVYSNRQADANRGNPYIAFRDYSSSVINGKFKIVIGNISSLKHTLFVLKNPARKSFNSFNSILPWVSNSTAQHFFQFLEPGDNIQLQIEKVDSIPVRGNSGTFFYKVPINKIKVSGKGCEKLLLQKRLFLIEDSLFAIKENSIVYGRANMQEWGALAKKAYNRRNIKLAIQLEALEQFRDRLSEPAFEVYKSDIKFYETSSTNRITSGHYATLQYFILNNKFNEDELKRARIGLENLYPIINDSILMNKYTPSNSDLTISNGYREFYLSVQGAKKVVSGPSFNMFWEIEKQNWPKAVKDRFVTTYFIDYFDGDKLESLLNSAVDYVSTGNYRTKLRELQQLKSLGRPAYDFYLINSEGTYCRLSDFKGKIVFIDFWFTGCANCIDFYKGVVSRLENIYEENKNIVFVTIAVDPDMSIWKKSLQKEVYSSIGKANVINLYGKKENSNLTVRNYGVAGYPSFFIVDREGKVRENNGLRDFDRVYGILEAELKKIK